MSVDCSHQHLSNEHILGDGWFDVPLSWWPRSGQRLTRSQNLQPKLPRTVMQGPNTNICFVFKYKRRNVMQGSGFRNPKMQVTENEILDWEIWSLGSGRGLH